MSKKKRKHPENNRICHNCSKCLYIGEGDYICEDSNDIVISGWQPTECFCSCKGKGFEEI